MKIPKRIKIAGHVVTVKMMRNAIEKGGGKITVGLACYHENQIRLATHYAENKTRADRQNIEENFCHEVLHHICSKYGVAMKERDVNTLAAGLYQVLKDNKLDFSDRT